MPEQETFWTLLTDTAHWQFEVFLIILFDVIIGMLIWPWLRRFFKHHEEDDKKIEALEKKIEKLSDLVNHK